MNVKQHFGADPRVSYDVDVAAMTTYGTGGHAAVVVHLATLQDLAELSDALATSPLPLRCVGNGSNLVVGDGPLDVVVVHLAGEFATLRWSGDEDVEVHAGGGLALPVAARRLSGDGVVGFEWAVGVPGTFGGATVMNAGGHGADMADSLVAVTRWRAGQIELLPAEALDLTYRHSSVGDQDIIVDVELRLARGEAAVALERVKEIVRWRREHQPGGHNAGSVFANPRDDSAGRLIEAVGAKGQRWGSAQISSKHANFIQVDDDGTSGDVVSLMREVRRRVGEETGVWLETEHRFIGVARPW